MTSWRLWATVSRDGSPMHLRRVHETVAALSFCCAFASLMLPKGVAGGVAIMRTVLTTRVLSHEAALVDEMRSSRSESFGAEVDGSYCVLRSSTVKCHNKDDLAA